MAVFTPVSDDVLQSLLARYDIGTVTGFRGIAEGVENTNYYLKTTTDRYILTLFERRTPEADLPFFVRLMSHLTRAHFPAPQPIADNTGKILQRCEGRPALIVSFLDGAQAERITPAHCSAVGHALASMHNATKDFTETRANSMSFSAWDALCEKITGHGASIDPKLDLLLADELEYLREYWPMDLPKGVIHADLFPDNCFFHDRHDVAFAGIIDFYFACTDILLYEIAICINAWCFTQHSHSGVWEFNPEHAQALCTAYMKDAYLTEQDVADLPVLCRGAALRFLLTRAHDMIFPPDNAMVTAKDPQEYLDKLAFHQQVYGAEIYIGNNW